MSDCGVCLSGYDGQSEFYHAEIRTARKPHKCYECDAQIVVGQRYEYASGKCDGDLWSSHTCLICAEISIAFSCEGRMHGNLWEDMQEVLPELNTGCLNRLKTVAAKEYLLNKWREWKGL